MTALNNFPYNMFAPWIPLMGVNTMDGSMPDSSPIKMYMDALQQMSKQMEVVTPMITTMVQQMIAINPMMKIWVDMLTPKTA